MPRLPGSRTILSAVALVAATTLAPRGAGAQGPAALPADSGASIHQVKVPQLRRPVSRYWTVFASGFVTSILVHESGHVGTALALGKRPTFGFDKGRPTVYSGINAVADPHDQFLFSSAGLVVQNLLDELILDVPHRRGSTFERGILAGGIATSLFYVTIGRNGSVSDVEYMQRTSGLNKADITLIFGGTALLHAWRIHKDGHYADFFARPSSQGGLRVGVNLD